MNKSQFLRLYSFNLEEKMELVYGLLKCEVDFDQYYRISMIRVLQVFKEELGFEGWSVGDVIGVGEVGESVNVWLFLRGYEENFCDFFFFGGFMYL